MKFYRGDRVYWESNDLEIIDYNDRLVTYKYSNDGSIGQSYRSVFDNWVRNSNYITYHPSVKNSLNVYEET